MPIDLNQPIIDLTNQQEFDNYAPLLANLQGNILKPHGRDYAVHLFLEFGDDVGIVKKWISIFTKRYLTSALRQYNESREIKINEIPGHLFAGVYLSAKGYEKLGFPDLAKFDETDGEIGVDDVPEVLFKNGMKDAKSIKALNDPPVEEWQEEYRNDIHALILLADSNEERLNEVVRRIRETLNNVAKKVFQEDGNVLRTTPTESKPRGDALEHFGFRDGISQPLFYKSDLDNLFPAGTDLSGPAVKWNPSAPLSLVLVNDPLVQKEDCFGSYLVFRKLEQNVRAFNEAEKKLAEKLNLPDAEKERAGALIVGRFKNGMPVISSRVKDDSIDLNNFNYLHADSDNGNKTHSMCPYHAHIRKTNPRGESDNPSAEPFRRIVRRGITYGKRDLDADNFPTMNDEPETGVGLLFVCFQRSIPKQFAFIQSKWANDPGFPKIQKIDPVTGESNPVKIGLDPIVERKIAGAENIVEQKWCSDWGNEVPEFSLHISDLVTLKGGELFFAPSIPFLSGLAETANE